MIEVKVFSVEKILEMTTVLPKYEAKTIFHVFVKVVQCIFVNALNGLTNFAL